MEDGQEAVDWFNEVEPYQWAQSFDGRSRCGYMTTNLAEAMNFVFKRVCHLPISIVFSVTFYKLIALMPKIGSKQEIVTWTSYIYLEDLRKAMDVN